jgi:pimeloyl-ACP methyl ester carboxylesterase
MKSWYRILFLLFVLIPGLGYGSPAEDFETGKIVNHVATLADSTQSYALYLPSSFNRKRSWPLLFAFEPGARSEIPLTLFKPAAEQYGYIVICSNNLKNGPWKPILKAMKSVWQDVLNRFPLDFNRIYTAGFSGGARASAAFPHITGQRVAGIIACGAGLPPAVKAEQVKPAYYHGIVGIEDYNYKEMVRLNRELESAGVDHFIQVHTGDHSWPPEELCHQAIEFMEIRAMKSGLKSKDLNLAEKLLRKNIEYIRELETVMNPYFARNYCLALSNLFRNMVDIKAVTEEIIRLEETREFKKFRREEDKRNQNELEYIRRFLEVFIRVKNYERKRFNLKKFLAELDLEALVRESSKAKNRYQQAMAKRLLDELVSKGNQEGAQYLGKKDFIRAEFFYQVAARAYKKGINSFFNLARIQALQNNTKKAMKFLKIMAANGRARGLSDFSFLLREDDLKSLRNEPEFKKLVEELGLMEN